MEKVLENIWNLLFLQLVFPFLLMSSHCLPNKHLPTDYRVVFASQVDMHGSLMSHNTMHHIRSRRSISLEQDIYINITGKEVHFHLRLSHNRKLLAPGFKVYHRHHANASNTERTSVSEEPAGADAAECIYRGHVLSHDYSLAALSLCHGVTGILRLPEEDYVVEPMPQQLQAGHTSSDKEQIPHIIYKSPSLTYHNLHNHEAKDYSEEASSSLPFTQSNKSRLKRNRRSSHPRQLHLGDDRTVETLVVVDKTMYWKHGKQNITTYILSIFNIVSQLFQDSSIGKQVDIVLVGLVLLESDEPGLQVSFHADRTLNSFCQWQSVLVGSSDKHHDHAILLTGLDICSYKDAPCDTLGFAPIKGMCNPLRSCIVNEDTGLATAFTIAHEIGHNFGMFHDGEGNFCKETAGNIMSPTLTGHNGLFRWSTCSRGYLHKFLNTGQSDCLTDEPKQVAELKFPEKLPGQLFDANIQCKLQFGRSARVCTFEFGKQELCKSLWCFKGKDLCETKFLPAAEGTPCSPGKWCRNGKCIKYSHKDPRPVDGEWSEWSQWTECTRTCGTGIKHRKRQCNDPLPQYGGKLCRGDIDMYKLCSQQKCPDGSVDFRSQQCKMHNQRPFRGWYYKWKPYKEVKNVEDQCKLYCQAENYNFFFAMDDEVKDGTRCNEDSDNICIKGICRPVGCDLIVGSSAINDRCGVCKGDNSTCDLITGAYTEQPRHNTYFPIVVLPKGARSVSVREKEVGPNYLSVRNIYGSYYLNGNWRLDWDGTHKFGGSRFMYKRPYNKPESLFSEGPLEEDLVLEILVQGANSGILYEYTLPERIDPPSPPPPRHNYTWIAVVTRCSELCAGGEQTATAHCNRDDRKEVDPAFCDPRKQPKTGVFPCNTDPCPARWVTESWGQCSRSCGGGRQKRKVICKRKMTLVHDKKVKFRRYCRHLPKPEKRRRCNTQECPPRWHAGRWSFCSVTCGKGTKSRETTCRRKTSQGKVLLPESMCQPQPRLRTRKPCYRPSCPFQPRVQWVVSSWSRCSVTCGQGRRTRTLKCSRSDKSGKFHITTSSHCHNIHHPNITLTEHCKPRPCPQKASEWYASPWSQCSVSCGHGVKTRLVHCIDRQQRQLSTGCILSTKPTDKQHCQIGTCPTPDPHCVDVFQWCKLVPVHNICDHNFYGKKCCKSCQGR